MTSSYRALERLPPEIFENLVPIDEQDNGNDDDKNAITTSSGTILLQNRICNKLKSFPRKISGRFKHRCVKNVGDFLKISETELVYGLDPLLTFAECRELRRRICAMCATKPCTVLSMMQQAAKPLSQHTLNGNGSHSSHVSVSSGIPVLDRLLQGGFRVGSVTEIFGRAGTGKTQLAMQICMETAKQGMAAAYIETEGKFSLERLEQIALANTGTCTFDEQASVLSRQGQPPMTPADSERKRQTALEILSRILLYSAMDTDELRSALSAVEVEACSRSDFEDHDIVVAPPIGIIVLDSIASPARRDFGKGGVATRAQLLMDFAKALKRLAERLKLAVVVINHIGSTAFQHGKGDQNDAILDAAGALGNSWHHCASTRLRIECKAPPESSNVGRLREITVTKSSSLKRGITSLVELGQDGFVDSK